MRRPLRTFGIPTAAVALLLPLIFVVTSAAATSTWTATAPMPGVRASSTSTVLPDGKVLVAGGVNASDQPRATAYLYDPVKQHWKTTGPMLTARAFHVAVLLPNGTVLVAGGLTPGATPTAPDTYTAAAELYDPATGAWTAVAPMVTARSDFTATLLGNGRVLVAGGDNAATAQSGVNLRSAEIFNPGTHGWKPAGPMAQGRSHHTATLLSNGNVLVTGGYRGSFFDPYPGHPSDDLAAATVYNAATGQWQTTGDLVIQRFFHTATLLRDGTVLVAGGYPSQVQLGSTPATPDAEIYNPTVTDPSTSAMGTWSQIAPLHGARANHSAVLLADGRLLVAGGVDISNSALSSAETYDPATSVWVSAGTMLTPRSAFVATLLSTAPCGSVCNEVLVAGGANGLGVVYGAGTANAELLTP